VIAFDTALLVGAGYWSMTRDFNIRAGRDIDINLRTLTLAFGKAYPNAKNGTVDRVEMRKLPEFADRRIVDCGVWYFGGNATLFVYGTAPLCLR
jgi:methyl-accepting chemotaxis protein